MLAFCHVHENGTGTNDMPKFANGTILSETLTEAYALLRSKRVWAGLLGASLIAGLSGPFGTYENMLTAARIGYWALVIVTTFFLGYLVSFLGATFCESFGISPIISAGLGAAMAGLPVTAWIAGIHVLVFDAAFWADAVQLLPYVVSIAVVLAFLTETLFDDTALQVRGDETIAEPAWLDTLPPHLGRDLILLQAQDHYIRVETKLGEALIRGKLQDAASELGDYGLRLHRSWWAARRAIVSYRYKNGVPVVTLENGTELPVGRTYRRSVRTCLS